MIVRDHLISESSLKKTIGNARLAYDELLTAVTKVEMISSSRPLSYVSADDMEAPITPSHLLIGCRILTLPMYPSHKDPDYGPSPSAIELTCWMQHFNKILRSNGIMNIWLNSGNVIVIITSPRELRMLCLLET